MKTLVIIAILALAAADDDFYNLEKLDIEALATNIGEFKKFNDCLINKGPCTDLYMSYKVHVRESTIQACKKCTPVLKHFAYRFYETLKANFPEDYVTFRQIYDPENKYFDAMENEVNKYKTL